MRTTVVLGMLGSGKTTFIGHLLQESREPTVVLVNDFGAVARAKELADTDRGPWRFDLAFGTRSSAPFAQPIADSRMVVIGTALDSGAIRRELPADRTS